MSGPAPGRVAVQWAVLRALGLRCPHCGASWARSRIVRMAPRCGACGLGLDRGESDYFLGAYTINLLWALLAATAVAVAAVVFPVSPLLIYGLGIPAIAALAVWLYPRSRLVWLAVDLQFRPATARDFEASPASES